jgi:hypothetical protein
MNEESQFREAGQPSFDKEECRKRLVDALRISSLEVSPAEVDAMVEKYRVVFDPRVVAPKFKEVDYPGISRFSEWAKKVPLVKSPKAPDMSHITGAIPWWKLIFTRRLHFEMYQPEPEQKSRVHAWTSSYNKQWYVWLKLGRRTLVITGDVGF